MQVRGDHFLTAVQPYKMTYEGWQLHQATSFVVSRKLLTTLFTGRIPSLRARICMLDFQDIPLTPHRPPPDAPDLQLSKQV